MNRSLAGPIAFRTVNAPFRFKIWSSPGSLRAMRSGNHNRFSKDKVQLRSLRANVEKQVWLYSESEFCAEPERRGSLDPKSRSIERIGNAGNSRNTLNSEANAQDEALITAKAGACQASFDGSVESYVHAAYRQFPHVIIRSCLRLQAAKESKSGLIETGSPSRKITTGSVVLRKSGSKQCGR